MASPAAPPLPSISIANPGLLYRRSFRAMNTDIAILMPDATSHTAAAACERFFHAFEARFSRFRPDSELSLFNARRRPLAGVSPLMLGLLSAARRLNQATGGVFDPAVLPNLEAAGYDRSFEQVTDRPIATGGPSPATSIAALRLYRRPRLARLRRGVRIDLGGIGKGYAVDVARRYLGERDFLIDAGGDIFASGSGPDMRPWRVTVADPSGGLDLDLVELSNSAIATSSTHKRRWRNGDTWAHHLIDPRTGLPAATDTLSVSVIAPSAATADVYAKTALILGSAAGSTFLQSKHAAGLFVLNDASVICTSRWPEG